MVKPPMAKQSSTISRPLARTKYKKNLDFASYGWLVVSGFNAALTAEVVSWRSVTHMCFLTFSHQY